MICSPNLVFSVKPPNMISTGTFPISSKVGAINTKGPDGKPYSAWKFRGTGNIDYINFIKKGNPNDMDSFTVIALVKLEAINITHQHIFCKSATDLSTLGGFGIGHRNATGYVCWVYSAASYRAISVFPTVTNKWNIIVGRYNGKSGLINIWVDGKIGGYYNVPISSRKLYQSQTNEYMIGMGPQKTTNYTVNGSIGKVELYKTALSMPEISSVYNEVYSTFDGDSFGEGPHGIEPEVPIEESPGE